MFENTAHVYDLVYEFSGKDYQEESRTVTAQIRERTPAARSLLDVACGTGGHLVHLRDQFDVVGLDIDSNMLAEARRRMPDVDLVEADMRRFDIGRKFDAVVCLFSSIGYLPDLAALRDAIACMASHIVAGGALIVDGWVRPEAWKSPGSVHAVSGQKEGVALARVGRSKRRDNKTLLELHHLVATSDGVDYLMDTHEMTLFTDQEYLDAFREAGLSADLIEGPFTDRGRFVGSRRRSSQQPAQG